MERQDLRARNRKEATSDRCLGFSTRSENRPDSKAGSREAKTVLPIGFRPQRTLAAPAEVSGVGFVTGERVRLRFQPAGPDHGVKFVRTDRPGRLSIPALASRVSGTERRTTLGRGVDSVTLVEHVLSALSGLRIDNCVIEMDGPEPPGLDGSAFGYVQALLKSGTVLQPRPRIIWTVEHPVTASEAGATVTLYPCVNPADKSLWISYRLNYGLASPIAPQMHTVELRPAEYMTELACCRTFILETEAERLRSQGIGRHLTAEDVLVFGRSGPINNRLRFANEPARHKLLDLIGDLALCPADFAGHLVAYRSGHALNVKLAMRLMQMMEGSRNQYRAA